MTHKKVVVVLGMHRSGTSAIARGLKVLSVDLGDNLMPGIEGENDKGFFEDLDIQKFNERLLAKGGSAWHSLSQVPTGSFEKHAYAAERIEAAELIERKLAHAQTFGFKDPRTALLLPFWQCIFRDLGISDSYVIAVRSPLEVAESLRKRGQTDPMHSALLWLKYNWAAITHSSGRPRLCVSYARFLDDRYGQLSRIASAFDLPMPSPSDPEFTEFAGEFLEAGLRHNRISDNEVTREETLPGVVAPLYQALLDWASADPGQALELPSKLRMRVEAFWENTDPVLQYGDRMRHSGTLARSARAKAEAELSETKAALEKTQSALAKLEPELLAAREANDSAQKHLAELGSKASALEAQVSETHTALSASKEEAARLKADTEAQAARIRQLEDEGAAVARAAHDLRLQLDEVAKAKAEALSSLTEIRAQADHLRAEKDVREQEYRQLENARAAAEHTATDLRRQLDKAQTENAEFAAKLAAGEAQTHQLMADIEARELRLTELGEAAATAKYNADDLRRQLDAVLSEKAELSERLSASKSQSARLRADIADREMRFSALAGQKADHEQRVLELRALADTLKAESEREVSDLAKQLREAEKGKAEIHAALTTSRAEADQLRASIAAQQKQSEELVAEQARTAASLQKLSGAHEQLKSASAQTDAQLSSTRAELAEKTKIVRLLRHEVHEIRSSTSWRLTKPIRAGKNLLSLPLRAAKRMIGGGSSLPPKAGD